MNPEKIEKVKELVNSTTIFMIGLGIAILILAVLIQWIRSRYRDDNGPTNSNEEILNQIEVLRQQGDVSDQEYRSIKSQITGRTDS